MRTRNLFISIFVISFMLGAGLMAFTPEDAIAKAGPPSPCSSLCGTNVVCGGSCGLNTSEVMHYRCRQSRPELWNCSGAWNCGCVAIGCGPACIDE